MKMPKQTAAVERKTNRFAHVSNVGRVRPSIPGWLNLRLARGGAVPIAPQFY